MLTFAPYQNLASFEGRAKFVAWLTRIAVHEALTRSRRRLRFQSVDPADESNGEIMQSAPSTTRTPEQQAYDRELAAVLEKAVLSLSEQHRLEHFMLRDVEELSTRKRRRHVTELNGGEREGASAPVRVQAQEEAIPVSGRDHDPIFPVPRSALRSSSEQRVSKFARVDERLRSKIKTAEAITVVHSPRLSPTADWVTLAVRTILFSRR